MSDLIHYEYVVYPRFKETDAYGIINHANFLSYIEEARIAFLNDKKLLDSNIIDENGGMFPVRDLYIKYIKSIKYESGEPVKVKFSFSIKNEIKFNFKFDVYYKNKKVAKGEVNNIYVNSRGELQVDFPEKLMNNYFKLLEENKHNVEKDGVKSEQD